MKFENREWELTVEGRYAAQCQLATLGCHLHKLSGAGKIDSELEIEIKDLEKYLHNHLRLGYK